jgi:hypothetical protein
MFALHYVLSLHYMLMCYYKLLSGLLCCPQFVILTLAWSLQIQEDISKRVQQMKEIIFGEPVRSTTPPSVSHSYTRLLDLIALALVAAERQAGER